MTFSALLLAGGASSRMGRDKAEVLYGGEPLWRVQLGKLGELGATALLVSAPAQATWPPKNLLRVVDHHMLRGPLAGIEAGLRASTSSHLLVLAVDMPLVASDDLRLLLSQCGPGLGAAFSVDRQVEPLAAVYPREALSLSAETGSARALVDRLAQEGRFRRIPADEGQAGRLRSANTPEDLAAME